MAEIKLSLQNKSGKNVAELNQLPQKVATKLSTIDFSIFNLAIETIGIVINEDENILKGAEKISEKQFFTVNNVPEAIVDSSDFQSKIAAAKFLLQKIIIDDCDIQNILYAISFPNPKSMISTKTAADEEKEDTEKRVNNFVPVEPKYSLDKVIMSKEMRIQIDDALSILRNRKKSMRIGDFPK